MASDGTAAEGPVPTSSALMAASKHISIGCNNENVAFLKCKQKDPNPEKCLDKGREVVRCVGSILADLKRKCDKEFDDYVGCMYYNTNEFEMCRKEQGEFEKACPFKQMAVTGMISRAAWWRLGFRGYPWPGIWKLWLTMASSVAVTVTAICSKTIMNTKRDDENENTNAMSEGT